MSARHSESATIMVCARTQPRLVRARGTRGGLRRAGGRNEAGARGRRGSPGRLSGCGEPALPRRTLLPAQLGGPRPASEAWGSPRRGGFHSPECLGSPQWPALLAKPALLSIPTAELPALAGLCQPAAVPGGGRGHKSPTAQPIRCLFPGEAGPTPPSGANRPSNQHREVTGNSGSCSCPRTDAANFCKGLVRSLAIPDESDSPGSH